MTAGRCAPLPACVPAREGHTRGGRGPLGSASCGLGFRTSFCLMLLVFLLSDED